MLDRRPRAGAARARSSSWPRRRRDARPARRRWRRDLAARGGHELVIAALVRRRRRSSAERGARLNGVRAAAAQRGVTGPGGRLHVGRRAAPTRSGWPAEEDVALLLLDAPEALLDGGAPADDLAALLARRRATSRSWRGPQRRGGAATGRDGAVRRPRARLGGRRARRLVRRARPASRCSCSAPATDPSTRPPRREPAARPRRRSRCSAGSGSRPSRCSSSPGTGRHRRGGRRRRAGRRSGSPTASPREGLGDARAEIARARAGPGRVRPPRPAARRARARRGRSRASRGRRAEDAALSAPTAGRRARPTAGCTGSCRPAARRR